MNLIHFLCCIRCTNADPNYGTIWFFCRQRPIDNPVAVMELAADFLMHEMVSAQPLYVKAVCHYVRECLLSCVEWKAESVKTATLKPTKHTPSMYTKLKRPSSAPTQGARGGGQDSGGTGPTQSTGVVSSDNPQLDLQEIWAQESKNDVDVLEDFEVIDQLLQDSPLARDDNGCLPLVAVNDVMFSAQDFVTSLIELNRMSYTKHLSAEDRRRVLFGSDQILP